MANRFTRAAFRRGYQKALDDLIREVGLEMLDKHEKMGWPWDAKTLGGRISFMSEKLHAESRAGSRDE